MAPNQINLPKHMVQLEPTVNVDQLAKDKVEEVGKALDQLTSLKLEDLNTWFSVLKQIITSADLHRTNDGRNKNEDELSKKQETGDSIYADYGDDNEQFNAHMDLSEQFATNSVKWTIRVQAFKIVHRLVSLLSNNNNSSKPMLPVLVKLLADLVRLAFVAATSPYDELKMQGFSMFKFLIENFAAVEEKEFPGHSILEQYKTQLLSAVKPAFNSDAPPYITAIACQICSLWICHGLEKEFNDVKRTYQLMLLSIEKLDSQGVNQHSKLYTESELEQERVDILGSWAQLDIASIENNFSDARLFRLSDSECSDLKVLIKDQVDNLVSKWWEALKDYALLIMPSPKFIGALHNEQVYTREVALNLFEPVWPKLVLAQTYRLVTSDEQLTPEDTKYGQFLCGIILRELSKFSLLSRSPKQNVRIPNSTMLAMKSLHLFLSSPRMHLIFRDNLAVACEFYTVLYNTIVNRISDQPFRSLLRGTLEKLFALAFGKISHNDSCLHYAIAKLITLLMATMKDIAIASKQESHSDLESHRIHLVIRLQNLISIILDTPRPTLNEPPLQEALITVFQEMLRFDLDKSVGLSLVDQLHHLYPVMSDSERAHLIDELYPEIGSRIKTIASLILDLLVKSNEIDRTYLAQLDVFFKAFRVAIKHSDTEGKIKLINSYVKTSNEVASSIFDSKDELITNKNKRELVDFYTNQVKAVEKNFQDEFKIELLCKDVIQKYNSLAELSKAVKTEIESKNGKLLEAKKVMNPRSGQKKPQAAKITLKADFSNFYATKKP